MKRLEIEGITSEELTDKIIKSFKDQIEQLKKEYKPKEPTEYLTRQEVADLLHIDISTVHNYTKRKKLQAYGICGRVYYKRHEVEQSLIKL